MSVHRNDEQFAFALVGRVLGVNVEEYDVDGRQGAVDALLHYPDGWTGALEVTQLVDHRVIEQLRLLKGDNKRRHLSGSKLWWDVNIGPQVSINTFNQRFDEALRLHELHRVLSPEDFFPDGVVVASDALQWFESQGVTVYGYPDTTTDSERKARHAGAVTIMVDGWSGMAGYADGIPLWLSDQATTEGSQIAKKIKKLGRSGHTEQHLVLFVDISADPFSFASDVGDEEEIPADPLQLGSVTHLWLIPAGHGHTYLSWHAEAGWKRGDLA